MIKPHGGYLLVDRNFADSDNKEEYLREAQFFKRVNIDDRQLADLELIAVGAYTPITGFMCRDSYNSVINDMQLYDCWNCVWPLPIVLAIDKGESTFYKEGDIVALYYADKIVASMQISSKYTYDKEGDAKKIFGTLDEKHPGVLNWLRQGDILLGGGICQLDHVPHNPSYPNMIPALMRENFEQRGWERVVAFQTRNVCHRSHEYIIKCALEICDGALIHPLVGDTKEGDVLSSVRMITYEKLLDKYFPGNRVILSTFPAHMRFAGPREAVFHAIVRKNYGCTHFIVGRDHAGVGNYYDPYGAQRIFSQFAPEEIGITPLFFSNAFWCEKCKSMATEKTCPHMESDRLQISGTEIRRRLACQQDIPLEVMRPELVQFLRYYYGSLGNP